MQANIRILNITEVFQAAGIESFIMNMYRNIDRDKVQFDFMVMRDEKEFYDDEIQRLGGNKYTISAPSKNSLIRILKESRQLYKFLRSNPYEIIHVHYTTPLRAFYILAAKRAGVPVRIYHSHSAEVSGKSRIKLAIYNFCKKKITSWGTHFFACSKVAADWMFEKNLIDNDKVQVIYNGIDIERFRYNESIRKQVREDLGIDNSYVLIHTGRFLEQKNHDFIIDVFNCLKKKCADMKLLLVGTGELVDTIKSKVKACHLEDDVIFLGVRSDVERLLSAADCYIMPSLYEGLPVAAIEAECSGLPCVFSKNITEEVALVDNIVFLSLDDSLDRWCDAILAYRDVKRVDCTDSICNNGYYVKDGAKKLQDFYLMVSSR